MIKKENLTVKLLEACPSFKVAYDALDADEKSLDYIVAGYFAQHLLNLYKAKELNEFPAVVELIEQLHVNGDKYVQEYATIGLLEGIQNSWGDNETELKKFTELLLPVSLKWWKSLNKFWSSEIPHVGADIKDS